MQHFQIPPGFPPSALAAPRRVEPDPGTTDAFLAALVSHAAAAGRVGDPSGPAEDRTDPDQMDDAATAPDPVQDSVAADGAPAVSEAVAAVFASDICAPRLRALRLGEAASAADAGGAYRCRINALYCFDIIELYSTSDDALTFDPLAARDQEPATLPLSALGGGPASGAAAQGMSTQGAGSSEWAAALRRASGVPVAGMQAMVVQDDAYPAGSDDAPSMPRGPAQHPPILMTEGPAGRMSASARLLLHALPFAQPASQPLRLSDTPGDSVVAMRGEHLEVAYDATDAPSVDDLPAAQAASPGSRVFGPDAAAAEDSNGRVAEQSDNGTRDRVSPYSHTDESLASTEPLGSQHFPVIVGTRTAAHLADLTLPIGHLPADLPPNGAGGADPTATPVLDGPDHSVPGIDGSGVIRGELGLTLTLPVSRDIGTVAATSAVDTPRAPPPATQIAHAVLNVDSRITELLLRPDELGQVRIEMRGDDSRMILLLSAERTETLDLLRRHADQLVDELMSGGVETVDLAFGRWDDAQEGSNPAESATPDLPVETEAQPPMATPFASAGLRPALYLRM